MHFTLTKTQEPPIAMHAPHSAIVLLISLLQVPNPHGHPIRRIDGGCLSRMCLFPCTGTSQIPCSDQAPNRSVGYFLCIPDRFHALLLLGQPEALWFFIPKRAV